MTCEVRLEGFADINEIGWYATIVRELPAAGDHGRGEATVILIVACVLILLCVLPRSAVARSISGRVRGCNQIITPMRDDVERIAEQGEWYKEPIRRQVVHLRILNTTTGESGLFELPVEMRATIFKDMAQCDFVVWIPKVIENRVSNCHVDQVSQTIEIRRRTYNDTTRP
jgi:hypothetical protein